MYSFLNIVLQYTLEMSTVPKFLARHGPQIVLFGPARLGINILLNLCNGLNIFWGEPYENFVKYRFNL